MSSPPPSPRIGVFDSGVGGLTVLRSLLTHLPNAQYLYLGDTARLPYGSKSRETVVRYAVSAAQFLLDAGAGQLVIACNTASALALPEIRSAVAPVPVLGVIEPGAEAAHAAARLARDPREPAPTPHPAQPAATQSADVIVLATAATVGSHAYRHDLAVLGLSAAEKSCPLLVPLVEEGWTDHPVTADVLRIYLREAIAEAPRAHTLLLGCTHYPLLRPLLERVLGELDHPMTIIDSADATAQAVAANAAATPPRPHASPPSITVYATDSPDRFQSLGSRFLGRPLPPVQLISLGG